MDKKWKISGISLLVAGLLLMLAPVAGASAIATYVVISEIQIDSIDGSGGTNDDWIELYNPTDSAIDLAAGSYRIERRLTAGTSIAMRIGEAADGTFPGGTIMPAHGFYLVVRDDANATLLGKADAIVTRSFTLTDNNSIYLGTGPIADPPLDLTDPDLLDLVGYGGALSFETLAALAIPDGQSLQRRVWDAIDDDGIHGPAWDSGNNHLDFFVQGVPNPQNSAGPGAPPIPEPATMLLLGIGLSGLAVMGKKKKK